MPSPPHEQDRPVIWEPPPGAWSRSRLAEFAGDVHAAGGPRCGDYRSLLDYSLAEPGAFWSSVADHAGVRWHDEPSAALADATMPGAAWFPGGTLNHAEFALRLAPDLADRPAIVGVSQTRDRVELSWADLVDQVARCRAGLAARGVGRGDRVVAFLPTIPETTVAFLATASLGAIWSSCAPEFGVRAVTDRWTQVEPTLLLAVDGYGYGEKRIDRTDHVDQIIAALPTLEHVVHVPYLDPSSARPGADRWSDLLGPADAPLPPLEFEPVPFDHPLYVLFSSGTTGLPKPIVHGHGGITLEHWKALALHYDLRPEDRLCWFTTTGWMMWNFLASATTVGSTAILFDGDPGAPDLGTLWRLAADECVDVFGISAPFAMACRKAGITPGADLDLGSIRHVGSTGAPLPPEGFEWLLEQLGADVQIGSMSGGTDVCTAFVGAAPTLPVRRGEITTCMLGCDVRAVRPDGARCEPGETGELVVAQPMPSMPVGFWNDETEPGERVGPAYRAAYFDDIPGVWTHGDWITFTAEGSCVITGRSDATLNRGGVRLGTSDFYTVVESLDVVSDSLVVHLEDDAGGPGELILLVALTDGVELDDELTNRIRASLRAELSPRHVPDRIDRIRLVPRTLSGKKLEVPVKRMLLGAAADQAVSRDSLADPTALDDLADWIASRRG
ncbi:MAG: acetoacetate--CoA ligase [Actinomycetota bacterium]